MAGSVISLKELPWLPRLAPDFRDQLRAIENNDTADWGKGLRALATQCFGINQAMSLTQALARLKARAPTKALTAFRLGLVSNSTTDFLKPFLVATALRHGIALEVIAANFGQLVQEAVNPTSDINRARPDAVLIAIDHRGLPLRNTSGAGWPLFDATAAIAELNTIRDGFRTHSGAVCMVQSIPAPVELLFGSLDATSSGTVRGAVNAVNTHLARDVGERGDVLIDVEWLAQCIGLDEWYDDRHWHLARVSCSQKVLPLYADFVVRAIAAMRGKARKCLVLDLDNTLWGGVIGDDGMDGVALNPGDARGEAHRSVQTLAADLRRRGVVLAVCSKNDDAIAREPFKSHPGMILREDDIAVFMANWDDKATNLERIAQRLDLGLDALVLLDDNPAERAQVRQALPQVAVPEIGEDASSYVRVLAAAGYFESIAFTQEDLARAEQYRNNAQRAEAMDGARNLDEFLQSLTMEIEFAPFRAGGRKRTAQLINKTNQFNLTTRRYTEQQVASLEESQQHYTLQVAVRDKFGDNGMIAAVICARGEQAWEIESWLMSCRVLNRGVEQAICNRIVADARRAGAQRVVGVYLPTDRNGIVKDLYHRLGFELIEDSAAKQVWSLDIARFAPLTAFFTEREAAAP